MFGTKGERMGFLLWRPQLLSELWDQVSLGNNWRPLEKNTLRTWQQAEARPSGEGRGGGWYWPKCRPRLDPSPRPHAEEQLRGERAWTRMLASPCGAQAEDRRPGAGSCGTTAFGCSSPGPPYCPVPAPPDLGRGKEAGQRRRWGWGQCCGSQRRRGGEERGGDRAQTCT